MALRGSLVLFPIAFSLGYLALLAPDASRPLMVRLTQENLPIELLTFLAFLAAGFIGIELAYRRRGLSALHRAAYALAGAGLLLIAMEEISWGQWFFRFPTPQAIRDVNTQGEFNLHNLQGIGGNTEYLRLAYGVAGLLAIGLARWRAWAPLAPPRFLLSWFGVIALFAMVDLRCDLTRSQGNVAKAMDVMSEVVELLIALSACLYFLSKSRGEDPASWFHTVKPAQLSPSN